MKRQYWWISPFHSLLLLWHQCGEDLGVFCYRITEGAFVRVHERAVVTIQTRRRAPGTGPTCSNSSVNLFTDSMM
jgi:hypothetical protein